MKNLIQSISLIFFDNSCPLCMKNIYDKDYEICYNCYNKLKKQKSLRAFKDLYYCFNYEGDFKKLLLKYKSNGEARLSRTIALLIKDELFEVFYRENIDLVIPVPISVKRRRERGFNQVEEVLKLLKYRYVNVERRKDTKKMYKILDQGRREKNIEGSFFSELDIEGKNILIIDDIVTTGATLRELSKTLSQDKANKIVYFSFALSKTGFKNRMRGVLDAT